MHFRQRLFELSAVGSLFAVFASAQMIDNTQAQPTLKAGINKSLQAEIGAGRGDVNTPGSSIFIINRDPFRSISPRAPVVPTEVYAFARARPK